MYRPKKPIFYDANCFTIMPLQDIKYAIKHFNNFMITPAINEVRKGKQKHPHLKQFDVVIDNNSHLRKEFNEISLSECLKDRSDNFSIKRLMFLRKNPILCSAYYTWMLSAVNPAIIHDFTRHVFNEIIYEIKNKKGSIDELSSLEARARVEEIRINEMQDKKDGRNLLVKRPWLLQTRKKRLNEYKENNLTLTDYQTLTTALLFSCFHGEDVIVWTADRDLVDIKDNLYKSIIERYAVNNLLKNKIASMGSSMYETELMIDISMQDINDEIVKVLQNIKNATKWTSLTIMLYRQDFNKVFNYSMKIPGWLRDFILSYKKNLECISLSSKYEQLYNISYKMQPDFKVGIVTYQVTLRQPIPYKVCIPFCEQHCRYPRIERENPSAIGEFIERLD